MVKKAPKLADRFLSFFIKGELLEETLGDLHEFHEELKLLPNWKRKTIYWFHVFHFMRPNLIKSLSGTNKLNTFGMIKINLKLAIRSLRNQRTITIPSLLTLIFGTLCFQLIYRWIDNEMTMDSFHNNFDRVYIGAVQTNPMADLVPISPHLMFQLDYKQFPEIEKQLLIHVYKEDETILNAQEREFSGKGLVVDSTFFSFFNFSILKGSTKNILADPTNIVLSGSFANRIFGNENPIGKSIKVSCDHEGLYKVVAVTDNSQSNSSIDFDFLLPRHSQSFWRRIPMDLVLVNPGFNAKAFNQKVKEMGQANTRFPESLLSFIPISSIYFEQSLDLTLTSKLGDKDTVQTLTFISFVIFIIMLLGFSNLQSTRQLSSANKMGIKHMIGGSKWSLCIEMIIERVIYLLLASMICFCLFEVFLPKFQSFLGLDLNDQPLHDFINILCITGGIVSISAIISAIQIYNLNLKETVIGAKNLFKISRIQRGITLTQYAITIVLLITTTVVLIQYRYMASKDPGFEHQDIVTVDFFEISRNENQVQNIELVKNRLRSNPTIVSFSRGDLPVSDASFLSSWKKAGKTSEYESRKVMSVDPGYQELLGIHLIEGRFFSDSLDNPGQQKVIINQAAMDYWEIGNISSEKLVSNTSGRQELEFEILGVVQDFHFEHLSKKIEPLVLINRPYQDDSFLVRFENGRQEAGISFLENLFEEVRPNSSFDFGLLNNMLESQYEKERTVGKVYSSFTLIALVLSSISLFTFSLYETKRRTKEIGIRKVSGASYSNIFRLLSFSFLKTVLIAFLIAGPFGWYFSNRWLERFAYRAEIEWWIFIGAGVVAGVLALFSILIHVTTVAKQNPINSLSYE